MSLKITTMDTPYVQDLLSIDMDDLGVRPIDEWIDMKMKFNQSYEEIFGKEKSNEFMVYSAELPTKLTTNEDDVVMSDDEDDDGKNEYDIDPETGEKIFRETSSNSTISLSPSNDKWIEEYLSNIESSSSHSILPLTTNQSDVLLLEDSDWLDQFLDLEETSDSMMAKADHVPDELSTMSLSSTLSVSIDDEYSTSSNSQQLFENNHQEISLIEPKLEKIDPEVSPMSNTSVRRSIARSSNQGQLDEEALVQYQIPLTVQDITESSTEVYNRHLARLSYLTSEQIHIIKDIRRRGKNKIAAQNCRKRKAVSVEALLEEVDELKRFKHELEERKRAFQQQIAETRSQYEYLHRQVLPDRQLPPAISVK